MENSFDSLFEAVSVELEDAEIANGPFHSAHEAWAVLLEEVDELWDEVKKKRRNRDVLKMEAECIQIAAAAIRFAVDVCRK